MPTTDKPAADPLDGLVLQPVLRVPGVARALGVSLRAVLRLHKRGELPLARVGGTYYITRQAFQRWLDDQTVTPERPEGAIPPAEPPDPGAGLLRHLRDDAAAGSERGRE